MSRYVSPRKLVSANSVDLVGLWMTSDICFWVFRDLIKTLEEAELVHVFVEVQHLLLF